MHAQAASGKRIAQQHRSVGACAARAPTRLQTSTACNCTAHCSRRQAGNHSSALAPRQLSTGFLLVAYPVFVNHTFIRDESCLLCVVRNAFRSFPLASLLNIFVSKLFKLRCFQLSRRAGENRQIKIMDSYIIFNNIHSNVLYYLKQEILYLLKKYQPRQLQKNFNPITE